MKLFEFGETVNKKGYQPDVAMMTLYACEIIFILCAILLIEMVGRRPILIASYIGMFCNTILLTFLFSRKVQFIKAITNVCKVFFRIALS